MEENLNLLYSLSKCAETAAPLGLLANRTIILP